MAYAGNLKHPLIGKVFRNIDRPSSSDIEEIASTYTGFIVDRLGKHGAMDPKIKPLDPESKLCGPAITVLGPDLTLRRAAADIAQLGDVLVIAAGGTKDYACFGDGTARKMRLAGVQGVVIDGVTRDYKRIKALNFPCFCKGSTLVNYDYPVFSNLGSVNVPVSCGNAIVFPGDLIFGDSDGVLVIPREFVRVLALGLRKDLIDETIERVSLQEGYSFAAVNELAERGYEVVEGTFPRTDYC